MVAYSFTRFGIVFAVAMLIVIAINFSMHEWQISIGSANILRVLAAGGIAGFMEVSLMYPLENVKTQLQLQDPLYPKFDGMIDCVQKTIRNYGCLGLYGGLTPLLLSSVPSHSIRWLGYENVCHWMDPVNGCQLSVFNVFISGLVSGVLVACVLGVPSECIKTRLIDEGERMVPIEGWRNVLLHCYKGVIPTVLKKVVNQGSRFPLYHLAFHALTDDTANPAHYPLRGFVAGIIAGFASVLLTQPIDVVKTKMQGIHSDRYVGSAQCLSQVYHTQGVHALYAGVLPRLVRVSIGAGITFSAYPVVKQWLRL
jgi:solute carrier family 25 citrate transporter 1